ncbi:MAG: hypothetical protein CMP11_03315 [Zetaproteobacteria bacterium]|nr:hypothetical protein [Pseudobdellovibrionaceae bacterium]
MKRSQGVKFPNSVQLFKFCQRILTEKKGGKVHDQEVGAILNYNPSDCSHWKRGEKNVKSVFALSSLADALQIEPVLLHDIVHGYTSIDEAYYEYQESKAFSNLIKDSIKFGTVQDLDPVRKRVEQFVCMLHEKADFSTPPLYLPEVLQTFNFISTQPVEMMDRLSRILKIKPGVYTIQFKKAELKPQTRVSITKDLARVLFEAERKRFPILGELNQDIVAYEEMLFVASLLAPLKSLKIEVAKINVRKNIVSELAAAFWVPKSLISLQLQNVIRFGVPSFSRTEKDQIKENSNVINSMTADEYLP